MTSLISIKENKSLMRARAITSAQLAFVRDEVENFPAENLSLIVLPTTDVPELCGCLVFLFRRSRNLYRSNLFIESTKGKNSCRTHFPSHCVNRKRIREGHFRRTQSPAARRRNRSSIA